MSSQRHSVAAAAISAGETQVSPSSGGTPTIPPITSAVGASADESGSSTTATTIGGGNTQARSASITTRGENLQFIHIKRFPKKIEHLIIQLFDL